MVVFPEDYSFEISLDIDIFRLRKRSKASAPVSKELSACYIMAVTSHKKKH